MVPDPMEYLRLANQIPQGGTGIYPPDSDALPVDSPIGGDPMQSTPPNFDGGPAINPSMAPLDGQFDNGPAQTPSLAVTPFGSHPSLMDQFHPNTTASDRLNNLIDNQPKPPDHASVWRRIGAGLTSLAYGPDEGRKVLNGNYDRDMSAWLNQAKLAQGAAQDENVANNQQRQIIGAQSIADRSSDKLEQQNAQFLQHQAEIERENKAKDEVAQEKLQTANARAQAYIFKNTHSNWVAKTGKDGKLTFFNPQDPTQEVNTGFDTGKMDDYDKLAFGLNAKLQEIGATGEQARQTEGVKQGGRLDSEAQREKDREDLANLNFANALKKPTTANQGFTQTTQQSTPPGAIAGFFGAGPTVKSTTTTRTPNTGTTTSANSEVRTRAIKALQDAQHPVTEANIAEVIRQLNAKSGGS